MRPFIILLMVLVFSVSPTFSQTSTPVQCGDIIESEFFKDVEQQRYTLELEAGTQIQVNGVALGDTLKFALGIYAPNADFVATNGSGNVQSEPVVTSGVVSATGQYEILAFNSRIYSTRLGTGAVGGIGFYTLYIGCTLRDGTIIEPGDTLEPITTEPQPPSQPAFSGFGFPGLAPVDFSAGIEIPILAGQPQTVPVGGDLVSLYTYDATANSTATLRLSRVSGDISIGASVIKRDTNEIVFIGGMPSSDNLSVELTFPSDGTYVIGLFQMGTAERPDTSGAVMVTIE